MLTGRESLARLVGKRRRFLPNRHSILSASTSSDFLSLCKKNDEKEKEVNKNVSETSSWNGGPSPAAEPGAFWVDCPVCGAKVSGENNSINSHLDACLSRGSKRKLSQRTLFELNFCSRPKVTIHSVELGHRRNADVCDSIPESNELDDTEECDGEECNSPFASVTLHTDDTTASLGGFASDDEVNDDMGSCSLLAENGLLNCNLAEPVDDYCNIFDTPLQTFIVGRRFRDQVDLNSGAKILLLRDPENVKDQNAVKVLSADVDGFLGFLPRELAQYLSPLMDKFNLCFEGHIIVAPTNSGDMVPIQITCQSKASLAGKEHQDFQVFKSLWRDVLRIVESGKAHPLGATKYQQNLVLLIQEVLSGYSNLLTDAEKALLESFMMLSDDSQRLFARLYTRKGPWFRSSTLSYPEISDCKEAIKGLSAAGYVSSFVSSDELRSGLTNEILHLLSVGELREILSRLKKSGALPNGRNLHGSKKEDLVTSLISSYEDGLCSDLPDLVFAKTGACVSISVSAESLVWRAERLFFLNGEQDLSAFLLVDLGIVKYPTYNCIFPNRIFSDREKMLSYEEAIEVAQLMDESLDQPNTNMVLRCIEISNSRIASSTEKAESSSSGGILTFLSCFTASWVYSKVVLLGVSFLEREKRYSNAISLLKRLLLNFPHDGRRGYWTLRLSIDLEHVGCLNESLQVAEDGLLDPWIRAGSRVALQRRVLRLAKPPRRWKIPSYSKFVKRKITEVHVQGRPLNSKAGTKSIFYGEDGEQCGVEQLALQYYAGDGGGWKGVHAESGIWLNIFGLLMWDIMFADVPYVFHTKFQTAPLDLGTDCFYEARKSLIEPLLERIKDGMAEEILVTAWETHFGTACRGVSWDRHSLSELRAAVSCIGGRCLASICRLLAQDYRSWSSGMPDLLLWRFHENYRGEAKLVEVKGPKDRLSEQQRAWLLVLMDSGFNVEVCKVTPLATV